MAREFRLPDLGSGLQEGQIVNWLVEVGQVVTTDDILCEVETEKSVIEIPVPYAGTVRELAVAAGETIEVGAVLALFASDDASPGAGESAADTAAEPITAAPEPGPAKPRAAAAATGNRARAMPSVRRFAKEHGIDLAKVAGTGQRGRVTRADIQALLDKAPAETQQGAAATHPAAAPETADFEKFTMIRRTIAERLSRSWREIPHVFTRMEIDASRLLIVRQALIEELAVKVPLEAILVKACLPALKEFPYFNATVVDDGIELHRHYHIGLAADTETGLVVPVLKSADRLTLRETVSALADLMPRAVARKATPEELSGATFTVNNIGALGHLMGTSIIPEGTTAILSVGRATDRPVAVENELEIRPILEVTLSFDHRAIDGGLAQQFMGRIRENLEEPVKALL